MLEVLIFIVTTIAEPCPVTEETGRRILKHGEIRRVTCTEVPREADATYYTDAAFTTYSGEVITDCCNNVVHIGDITTHYRYLCTTGCKSGDGSCRCQYYDGTGWLAMECPCAEPPC